MNATYRDNSTVPSQHSLASASSANVSLGEKAPLLSIALPDQRLSTPVAPTSYSPAQAATSHPAHQSSFLKRVYQQTTPWRLPVLFFLTGMLMMIYILHLS